MKSPTANFGMVRLANLNSAKTEAPKFSSSCSINLAPVRLVNTEATVATVSAPLSPSWTTSISTDSVRREQSNMVKVRGMVTAFETKAKAASEAKASKSIAVSSSKSTLVSTYEAKVKAASEAKVSKSNITVSGSKSVKALIAQFSN